MLAENEAPKGGVADLRHRDRPVAEMGKQKLAHDLATPTAGARIDAPVFGAVLKKPFNVSFAVNSWGS